VKLSGRLEVDLVATGAAVALLVAIVLRARRGAAAQAVQNDVEVNGPEPTEAEVEAAEQSIRVKTTEAVRAARQRVTKSSIVFLFLVLATAPFMGGMPLNSVFRPWGQLLLIGCAFAFAWAMIACSSLVVTWSYKRDLEKLLKGDSE